MSQSMVHRDDIGQTDNVSLRGAAAKAGPLGDEVSQWRFVNVVVFCVSQVVDALWSYQQIELSSDRK